jgi:hypothetical protein
MASDFIAVGVQSCTLPFFTHLKPIEDVDAFPYWTYLMASSAIPSQKVSGF